MKYPEVKEAVEAPGVKEPAKVPLAAVKEVTPLPAREPRIKRSSPELDELAAEVERIRRANELKAIQAEENTGAKVIGMKKAVPVDEEAPVKDRWWIYAAALAVIGLAALLVKVL